MENIETTLEQQKVNLKFIIAHIMADIDIFLLQDETQTKDLDKVYTKEEIREQLHKTANKMVSTLKQLGFDLDSTLQMKYKFGGFKI